MKSCNICHESKAPADFPVRRKSPDGLSYTCRRCASERTARYRKTHPGHHAAWYQANREHKRQYFAAWRAQHAEHCREAYRQWARANPDRVKAIVARRHEMKLRATPKWVDQNAMRAVYREASRLIRETGIRHEVDHIVPIRSPIVCGLHVPANLQILTSDANKKKSNRLHDSGSTGASTGAGG